TARRPPRDANRTAAGRSQNELRRTRRRTQRQSPTRASARTALATSRRHFVNIEQASQVLKRVASEVGRVLIGHDELVEHVLIGLLARGHVLLEGVPGLGKTLLVKALAQTLGLSFRRIQFTPDLMPSDVTGSSVYNAKVS